MSGTPRSVAVTQTTRPPVPAPTTWADLFVLFARALDEAPMASRLHR